MKLAAVAAFAAVVAVATSAHADEPSAPKTETRWYGYQTLAADGAAVVMTGITIGANGTRVQEGLGVITAATWVVTPAIIHGAHGQLLTAVADAGIRFGAPILCVITGFIIGNAIEPFNIFSDDLGAAGVGALVGFGLGVAGASVLDAAVFARETVPVDDANDVPPSAPKPQAITLVPQASAIKNGVAAGLSGTF